MTSRARPRVLEYFPDPTSAKVDNPYTALLGRSLEATGVDVEYFTWKRAFARSIDVHHIHWPEQLVRHESTLRRALKRVLATLLIVWIRLRRTPVVRTLHNSEPHDGSTRFERWFLAQVDRATVEWIAMNTVSGDKPHGTHLIVHGHYRSWYTSPVGSPSAGAVLAFGLIRPYKGFDGLIEAFSEVSDDDARLRVMGLPAGDDLSDHLQRLAAADRRVSLDLRFIPDQDLLDALDEAEVVVLPYRDMNNSGAALLALSRHRPIIVPDTRATRLLEAEFGSNWVRRLPAEGLTARTLRDSLEALRASPRDSVGPDMSSRDWEPLAHALKAVLESAAGGVGGRREALGAQPMRRARYYRGARTTHLERLHQFAPGDFLYLKPMYDFDLSRAPAGQPVRQVTLRQVLRAVWQGRYATLEIVEPYAPSALPQSLAISLVLRLARLAGRPRTELVTYAIENADLVEKFSAQFRLPRAMVRLILRTAVGSCYSSLSRIAFGTEAAEENYRELLGTARWSRSAPERVVIPGLPAARENASQTAIPSEHRVLFLGAFDRRKGLPELIGAWPSIAGEDRDATLLVVGKGPMLDWVRGEVARLPRATLMVDPAREEIWSALSDSRVLFLLSQPAPGWKEQIGLPIVEALSVGLEVVASDETGIADWLLRHGHRVLSPAASVSEIAGAVVAALGSTRAREEIVNALPEQDGRLLADSWLHQSAAS